MGELGRRAWHAGQQRGEPRVQPGPLPGQQVVVDRLAQQRVPEGVAVRAVGDEQLVRDRLAHRLVVAALGQRGRGPDQVVGRAPAGHRRRAQHQLGRVGHPLHPGHEQRGEPGRQRADGPDAVVAASSSSA